MGYKHAAFINRKKGGEDTMHYTAHSKVKGGRMKRVRKEFSTIVVLSHVNGVERYIRKEVLRGKRPKIDQGEKFIFGVDAASVQQLFKKARREAYAIRKIPHVVNLPYMENNDE